MITVIKRECMNIIYKYELDVGDIQTISMPKGANILSTGTQEKKVFIWAGVNPYEEEEKRVFMIVGTGHSTYNPDIVKFIGTVFVDVFVWHIFEVIK